MFHNENLVYGDQNVLVPAHLNFGKYMLDKLRKKEDEIALENATTEEALSYKDLTNYAISLSIKLKKLGVQKGDIVALGSEKRINFIPTALAILFTGAIYTPYDTFSGKATLKHKIKITKPKYFIYTRQFWEMYNGILTTFSYIKTFINLDDVSEISLPVKNDNVVKNFEPIDVKGQIDTAFILYSSGTTGMPKGVLLTHLNCILNSLPEDFKNEELQTAFVYGEWYHNYDTFMTYKFLAAGRKIVYVPDVSEKSVLTCIDKCKVNIAMVGPSQINYWAKGTTFDDYNFDCLKILYSRSAPLHCKTIEKVKNRYPKINVLQGYGMTEAGELTSESWGTIGPKSGSVGKSSPGTILKIVDLKTNQVLGPYQHGEICVKGPVLMKGYIGVDPQLYLDNEGFLKTGDLGYYDENEYFYIVDRIKELIKYDGYPVAPLELETILQLHPTVLDAAVVGKPVPEVGEEPMAFVVKKQLSNVTEKDLVDYVANEVPPYMLLRAGVRFVEKIPRNPRGKILRRILREMINE